MDFAPLVPGLEESYVFPMTSYGEMEYKRMYRESRFGVTKRRAGWETMRIYEILACGSVPYIHAANEIPDAALVYVNKTLLRQAQQLVANAGQPPRDAFSTPTVDSLDLTKYVALAAELLRHTQQHLTTEALAKYILTSYGKPVSTALYVSGCFLPASNSPCFRLQYTLAWFAPVHHVLPMKVNLLLILCSALCVPKRSKRGHTKGHVNMKEYSQIEWSYITCARGAFLAGGGVL
ncbi:unnamed protein product [Durusdinium trenchii]